MSQSIDVEINDVLDIDDVLLKIKQSQERVDHFKELKKRRIKPLDESIKEEEARVESLKQIVQSFMEKNKQKTLSYPGVASVTVTNRKGSWVIDDEEQLADHLTSEGLFDEVGERNIKFNKTKLNKILNEYESNNNCPDSVHRDDGKTSLTIKFDQDSDRFYGIFEDTTGQFANRDAPQKAASYNPPQRTTPLIQSDFENIEI